MPQSKPILIASRGSPLALAQAHLILHQCQRALPRLQFAVTIIKTTGDKLQSASLAGSELPKGLFTKELETALLNHEADLAVHSLKDLPTELPDGLALACVTEREDPRDVLIERQSPAATSPPAGRAPDLDPRHALDTLPPGATVATSSTRREAQLRAARPDLRIVPIRGNVGTRLDKLASQSGLHATILAAAGLRRLGFNIRPDGSLSGHAVPDNLKATFLPFEVMLPCVGQAALGIETRLGDDTLLPLHPVLDHLPSRQCATAERAFLHALGGGCQLAVAALAEPAGNRIRMRAVSFLRGRPVHVEDTAPASEAEALGRALAAQTRE